MAPATARTLAQRRHEMIVAEVRRAGATRVTELARLLGVSDMTVRRDLDLLDEAGLIVKVHGGATVPDHHSSFEPGFAANLVRNTGAKSAVASCAADLVAPGSAIGITAGTTTFRFASELEGIADLTVITNSIRVADVLAQTGRSDRTVVLTGGVRTPSDALVGPVAVQTLRSLHLDAVFMGVHGMAEHSGFTTPNLLEAETNRAFVDAADRLIVLADHSKWQLTGLAEICALERADTVVSDGELDDAARKVLSDTVGRLVIAGDLSTDDGDTPSNDKRSEPWRR